MSSRLYSKEAWDQRREKYDKVGIDFELYDMKCEVFNRLFDETPDYFNEYQWINDEDGMPLWVRPGVNWVPQHELDDEYD